MRILRDSIQLLLLTTAFSYPLPDTETHDVGTRVSEWTEASEVNPEELGEYLEGDIVPTYAKNGLLDEHKKWENATVPFEISGHFSNDKLNVIHKAIEVYHEYTCIRFRPKTPEDADYVSITNGMSGCWSSVGKVGGRQEVNLQQDGCLSRAGTAVHELMHALGFTHEQNRYDRDDYVEILWDNIKPKREGNFQKAQKGATSGYGVEYDYNSVLHYSGKAFSKNGQPTIVTKVGDVKIGQRDGFSRGDVLKLRAMYNCPENGAEYPDIIVVPTEEITDNSIAGGILSFLFS